MAPHSAPRLRTQALAHWATVNQTGLATPVGPGTATVTATAEGVTGAATMIVCSPPPAGTAPRVIGVCGG